MLILVQLREGSLFVSSGGFQGSRNECNELVSLFFIPIALAASSGIGAQPYIGDPSEPSPKIAPAAYVGNESVAPDLTGTETEGGNSIVRLS